MTFDAWTSHMCLAAVCIVPVLNFSVTLILITSENPFIHYEQLSEIWSHLIISSHEIRSLICCLVYLMILFFIA